MRKKEKIRRNWNEKIAEEKKEGWILKQNERNWNCDPNEKGEDKEKFGWKKDWIFKEKLETGKIIGRWGKNGRLRGDGMKEEDKERRRVEF